VPLADIRDRREFRDHNLLVFPHPSSDRLGFTRDFLIVADMHIEGA
jgi:hypothetical protein